VPAGNKDQLDILGTGAIIGASWATDGTDIIGDVRAIKKAALIKTGYPIRHAFYGANLPQYLLSNTDIGALIHASPVLSQAIAQAPSELPPGFLGLEWHPIDDAFFTDAAGTNQSWFSGDELIFTPDPSSDWWGFMEGTYPVPTSVDVVSSMEAALSSFTPAQGAFAYAKAGHNPPGVEYFAGDTFLPLLKNPWAIFLGVVVP
jgi:hypothetical protein